MLTLVADSSANQWPFTSFLQIFKQPIYTIIQNTYTLNFTKSKLSEWFDVSLCHVCIMCVSVHNVSISCDEREFLKFEIRKKRVVVWFSSLHDRVFDKRQKNKCFFSF